MGGGSCDNTAKALLAESAHAQAALIVNPPDKIGFSGGWAFRDTWTLNDSLVQVPTLAVSYSVGSILKAYDILVSHTRSLTLTPSHTHPLAHAHTHILTHTLAHAFTPFHAFSSHALALTQSHPLTLSHAHALALALSPFLTLTLSLCSLTHMRYEGCLGCSCN